MLFGLFYNNKYKIYDSVNKLKKDIHKIRYIIVDNSTSLKGPVYTLIDVKDVSFDDPVSITIKLTLSYAEIDQPCTNECVIPVTILSTKFEKKYSMYPLLKQILLFNRYEEEFLYNDNCLDIIGDIEISLNDREIYHINSESENTEKELKKICSKLRINTNVFDVLEDKHIVLKDNTWEFVKPDNIPFKFDYLFYNLIDTETMYMFSDYMTFYKFNKIEYFNISLLDKTDYDIIEEYSDYSMDDISTDNRIVCEDLYSLLLTCIYLNQIIDLEFVIYSKLHELIITLKHDTVDYKLIITEKDISKSNICLFDIIDRLLKIKGALYD